MLAVEMVLALALGMTVLDVLNIEVGWLLETGWCWRRCWCWKGVGAECGVLNVESWTRRRR